MNTLSADFHAALHGAAFGCHMEGGGSVPSSGATAASITTGTRSAGATPASPPVVACRLERVATTLSAGNAPVVERDDASGAV